MKQQNTSSLDAIHKLRASLNLAEIPSLFGIRGLAALFVVLGHIDDRIGVGGQAVTCFFVLSGFLITHLLLTEFAKSGRISLKRFYFRRTLRIFPAYFGYCGLYLYLKLCLGKPIDWPAYAACLVYVSNFYQAAGLGMSTMNHTWSLATEEQFYLLWPVLFVFFSRREQVIRALLVAIGCVWIYRTAHLFVYPRALDYVYLSFETRCDALALGCLCAVLVRAKRLPHWCLQHRWVIPSGLACVLLCRAEVITPFLWYTVSTIAFALMILNSITYRYGWLNSRLMRWLGKISYSMYLFHPFCDEITAKLGNFGAATKVVELLVAVGLGAGSYYLIERPCLRWRDNWQRARSKGRAVAAAA